MHGYFNESQKLIHLFLLYYCNKSQKIIERFIGIILICFVPFASQVSGLKSITSKHLALASQIISFIHSLIPGKHFSDLLNIIISIFLKCFKMFSYLISED